MNDISLSAAQNSFHGDSKVFLKYRTVMRETRELLNWSCILRQRIYRFDVSKLYTLLLHKIEELVSALADNSCSSEEIDKIKFMICTELDEAIVGYLDARELARYRSLTEYYYKEQLGGEHFFDILEAFSKLSYSNLPILSLGHSILCIGFKGQYGLTKDGKAKIATVKDGLFFKIKKILPDPKLDLFVNTNAEKAGKEAKDVRDRIFPALLIVLIMVYGVLYFKLNGKVQQLEVTIKESLVP